MMLITFEGGEGSGKGTAAERLVSFLESEGYEVELFREPGSVEVSEEIREVIQKPRDGKVTDMTELLLYEAARAQFVERALKPALENNKIVVLDRFYDSTTAYQGYGRGLDLGLIHSLNQLASQGITPDLTFYLDVSPEVAIERAGKDEFGDGGDRLEREPLEFHERVREGYLEMAERDDRFVVIDADSNNAEEVSNLVEENIGGVLE